MESLTTTSLGCLRQAAPHGTPAVGLLLVFIPHAFSSVNISVKNPGSAFILNIFPLRRFTIRRHLKKKTIEIVKWYISKMNSYLSQNLSLESSTKNGFNG